MSGTVLSRISQSSVFSTTPLQSEVDGLVSRFVEEATDAKTLASLTAASFAYRWGRLGVMVTTWARQAAPLQRPLSLVIGLGSEVTTFEFTNRAIQHVGAGSPRPIHGDPIAGGETPPLPNRNPNLWSWSGPGGWAQGLSSTAITFGMLKGAGFLAREQNLVFQHAFQATAMVAGHNTGAVLGITAKPEGSLAEQFLHAEAVNLQLIGGMGLVHALGPSLHATVKALDLRLQSSRGETSLLNNLLHRFSPQLSPIGAGGNLAPSETRKGPSILLMSSGDDATGGRKERPILGSISPVVSVNARTYLTLAIELGVDVPPQEFITAISRETTFKLRSKVMDLISTDEIASRLSPLHLEALRNFVIGGEGLETQLFTPLSELIRAGREEAFVDPPSDSTPTLPPPKPLLDSSSKELRVHEQILGTSPNLPGQPRETQKNTILQGLGEVSVFTETRGKPDKNDDAFGIGGNGVFVVAQGVSDSQGDLASALAVETVLRQMKEGATHLGVAFLEADAKIRAESQGGKASASAVRINLDGTVEAAIVGDVEIGILFWDGKGHYGLVPYLAANERIAKSYLGGGLSPPNSTPKNSPAEVEIFAGQVHFPSPAESKEPLQPLVLGPGDGILMMSAGLARIYNQRPPYQLIDLIERQTTAEGIRRAIQEDSLARLKTLQWRRGLKLEGERFPTLVRVKIPEGMPLSGDYIDNLGDVYDSKEGGRLTGYFGEESNQTALVFLYRPEKTISDSTEASMPSVSSSPPEGETQVLGVPQFPTDQPLPDSLAKVGAYLDSVRSYNTLIRYSASTLEEFIRLFGHQIHPGGIFIQTDTPISLGALVQLELVLKNGDGILKGDGQVIMTRHPGGSSPHLSPGMGVQFLGLDPESQTVLNKILAERK